MCIEELNTMMKLGHTVEVMKQIYPEITDALLEELKVWAEDHGVYNIPGEQLALFAQSCYFEKVASKRCMNTYYRMRRTVPEFFGNRDPKTDYLQHSLKALRFAVLPVPDLNGNRIIFHRLADTRPHQYMFDDGIKLLNMSIDASLYYNGCSPGYIFLFDMQGVRLGHLMRLSISSIRQFFEYLQDGLPVRLKGIYVVNVVWFMNKVLTLIKPFMKKELFEVLHLYSGDVSEIYERIPPHCLPSDYGGRLDSIDRLHEAHCRTLDELRDYFKQEEELYRGWNVKSSTVDSKQNDVNSATNINDNGNATDNVKL